MSPIRFFHPYRPAIPPVLVGRDTQLKAMRRALSSGHNVVVSGNRMIGKTSLLHTIRLELKNKNLEHKELENGSGILSVSIDMHNFMYGMLDDFTRQVLLEICQAIWTDVLNEPYSKMLEEIASTNPRTTLEKSAKTTVKRLAKLLMSRNRKSTSNLAKKGGAKLIAEASFEEAEQTEFDMGPLEAFEFLALMDELLPILHKNGIERVLIIADEANYLPKEMNLHLLHRNLEIFTSKNIQFFFASFPNVDFLSGFGNMFERVELKNFHDAAPIRQLANLGVAYCLESLSIQVNVENSAIDSMFSISEGHPCSIQLLCCDIFESAFNSRDKTITNVLVEHAADKFQEELQEIRDKNVQR